LMESGTHVAEIRQRAAVKVQEKDMGFAGHLTVQAQKRKDDRKNHIFFWYQPCTNCNSSTDPLLVWLQGGPGGPGTFGAMTEIGNWYIDEKLEPRERCFSWCERHSCLFVDQPVEAGFSYQTDMDGNAITDMDGLDLTDTSAEAMLQVHDVISQFLDIFSELRSAPLIITGESYGGLYTPNLGVLLANDTSINLAGLAVGDPCIDWEVQMPTYADTLYGLGVLMSKERDKIRSVMDSSVAALRHWQAGHATCRASFDQWNSVWDDDGHDSGGKTEGLFTQLTGSTMTEDILMMSSPASFGYHMQWFAKEEVAKAFHVENITKLQPSDPTLALKVYDVFVDSGDWCTPSAPLYADLLDEGKINLMIYTSNMDPLLGPPTTEAGIQRIMEQVKTSSVANKYNAASKTLWNAGDDKVSSGYAKCAANTDDTRFCYVVVRNAGHMTPAFNPRASMDMFNRFIAGESFEGNDEHVAKILQNCAPCGGAGPFAGKNVPACA